jgi:hypothetical protein
VRRGGEDGALLGGEGVVRLLVDEELEDGAGLVPARVVVDEASRRAVQPGGFVHGGSGELARVEGSGFEHTDELARRSVDEHRSEGLEDRPSEALNAHAQATKILDLVYWFREPPAHLHSGVACHEWNKAVGFVVLIP